MVPSRQRYAYWDNMKGLLIGLVVFAHFLYAFQDRRMVNLVVDSIYFFHMPAFVFVSGYFSKSRHARSAESLLRLFVFYLLLMAVNILISLLKHQQLHIIEPAYSAWYLIALVVWRLVTPYFSKIKGIIPILIAASLLAGFWKEIDNSFAFARILSFFPFFLAGYLFPAEKAEQIMKSPAKSRIAAGAGLFMIGGALAAGTEKLFHPDQNDFLFQAYGSGLTAHFITRAAIFLVAALCIAGILFLSPNRALPLLTKAGKNSMAIYLIHRPITALLSGFASTLSTRGLLAAAVMFTMASLVLLGSDFVSKLVEKTGSFFVEGFRSAGTANGKYRWNRAACLMLVLGMLAAPAVKATAVRVMRTDIGEPAQSAAAESTPAAEEQYPIYRVADDRTAERFDNAFRLLFAGDLILLEDQVKNAYDGNGYDFSECFEYTREYIESADYAIGVFEGPCAGNARSTYSSSNYADGKELFLNFPDEWAYAVKNAGFDLVTTANNHLLDRGKEGALRTLDVLDEAGLDHIGSYVSEEDKREHSVRLVEAEGIRFAVLSYTFWVNGFSPEQMMEREDAYLTSMIVDENSPYYAECLDAVRKDFEAAGQLDPDLIVVLPHWGTQFDDDPDQLQLLWEENFRSLGADIILGDHTHSVQPVFLSGEGTGKNVFTLYSPGNYANIYREYNGDFSALVEVYIDREEKKPIGGAVIPMWTESSYTGNYRPLPIYQILTDEKLGSCISTRDMERVAEAQEHITRIMLGTKVGLDLVQERFLFDGEGFFRIKNSSVVLTEEMRRGVLYPALQKAENVCFVGDSVTEGTMNGGVPWYEPMESLIPGRITNCGWGSATVKTLLEDHLDEITAADADLFVIAIGTNDVRYRQENICAMDPDAFIRCLEQLRDSILASHENADFVFIAPWYSTDGDRVSRLKYPEKLKMNQEYAEALRTWAESHGDGYIDANVYIRTMLDLYPHRDYMVDYIHPNASSGVELYSAAALQYGDPGSRLQAAAAG